ncbi:MAG: glycosyltransferase family 4 protein [Pyrinomonadaceae bacterium]
MIENRRRIIFCWTYLQWGGAQIYFLGIIKEAVKQFDVTVVLPRDSSPELVGYIHEIGVKTSFMDHHWDNLPAASLRHRIQRQWGRILSEVKTLRHLRGLGLRGTVVHIDVPPWQSWQPLTALVVQGANVFVTLHNALARSTRWRKIIWKLRLHFLARLPRFNVFTANEDTKNKFRDFFPSHFWDRIKVVRAGIDPGDIERATAASADQNHLRKQHGLDPTKFIVLCLGQFVDRKGRWVFLEAAKQVTSQVSDVQFVWVAPKPPTDAESARKQEYGLDENFRLLLSPSIGSTRLDILSFYRVADLFVLPSLVEGLPIALLEAMAMGVPAVSTNINAIPEAITDGETGILVNPNDAETLADQIIRLKNNEPFRNALGVKGREYVLNRFDERGAARAAISEYERAFANGS